MKLKKLLAAVTAAALAVTTMAVTSFTASAEDVALSKSSISSADLAKYETINITITGTAIPECGHERGSESGKHNDTDTYCSWGSVVPICNLTTDGISIDDAHKTYWFEISGMPTASSSATEETTTVKINTSAIISAIENDPAFNSDWTYDGIQFNSWGCTFVSVTGTPKAGGSGSGTTTTPSTGKTHTGSVDITAVSNGDGAWGSATITEADLLGGLDPTKTTIVFTGSGYIQFGFNSLEKPIENSYDNVAGNDTITVDASKLRTGDSYFGELGASSSQTVTWVATESGSSSGTPSTPDDDNTDSDTPSTGGSALWEGSSVLASWNDNVQISADKFANITSAGTIKITVVDVVNPGDWDSNMFGMKLMDDGWATVMTEFAPDNGGYGCMETASGTLTAEITAERLAQLKQYGMVVGGFGITITKVEYIAAGGSGSDTPDTPDTPSTPAEPTTPTIPDPIIYTPASPSQTTIADNIIAASDGGNVSINLGSSTKVDKAAMDVLAARGDVTVKFNVSGTAYWLINGNNVTNAKGVDLGVTVNSKAISEKKVADFAGDKDTIQLSLKHNGDLGFTGTLNIPVNKSYNGKFANLYYYRGGKFEFVGSSAVSNGRTQFAFSHASNYLIVIDDYAYGEDVSTGAGMTETTTEASALPYVAVLVLISAFAASAIVFKKRLSK